MLVTCLARAQYCIINITCANIKSIFAITLLEGGAERIFRY